MKQCAKCGKPRINDRMSQSKGATAGWCLGCVDAHKDTLRPPRICVKCKTARLFDQMSRSKGATAGWCLGCVAECPPSRAQTHRLPPERKTIHPHELIAFRRRYKLSQIGFAEAVGVSSPAVSSWERGKTPVPPVVLKAMSAFIAGLPFYEP